ncbi:Penicillin-binding protein 2 [Salmonella enterica subsp. enterica]|nr:Penicillin-binding protein 2 [Salmonella enterica subsp. enterica]
MTFKDFDAEEKLFLRRVIVAFGVVVVCFGILIFNLYNLQIRQHHYYTTRSNENDIKMLPVAPRAASFTIATAFRWCVT